MRSSILHVRFTVALLIMGAQFFSSSRDTYAQSEPLLVFAGDNGLSVGNHGLLGKQNLYDNSVRVPLIFCGPSVPANKRSDALVYLPDITPTVLSYTGVKKPASVESENLQPIISGQKQAMRKAVYYLYRDFQRGVRTEDNWKLIVYRVKGETRVELFDLNNDPYERNDLAGKKQYVKKTAELKTLLLHQMKRYGDNLTERDLWGSSNEQK